MNTLARLGITALIGLFAVAPVAAGEVPDGRAPTCAGRTATMVGTNGDDVLDGTSGSDVIVGLGGDDAINGLGGKDYLCGGSGDDTIGGGGGPDRIYGGGGNDTLDGAQGGDRLYGQRGRDTLNGDGGEDVANGGSGTDGCTAETTIKCESAPPDGIWHPQPGTTWQWQLSGEIDTSVDAEMFDVDLFEAPPSVIADLHDRGRVVVCYMSAGAWEEFRPDADDFPDSVLGRTNGWAGERWLDIRRLDVLGPIMESRMDMCRDRGFDGIEVDNIDGYANRTGFDLTAQDQLAFNRFLAGAAHSRGLSIGLKNDLDQVEQLEPDFDWALNEECAAFDECEALVPFIEAGKAVFHVEYDLDTTEFCALTTGLGFSSLQKHLDLDAWRRSCS